MEPIKKQPLADGVNEALRPKPDQDLFEQAERGGKRFIETMIKVKTTWDFDGDIKQTSLVFGEASQRAINTREKQVQKALMAMGWLPPHEVADLKAERFELRQRVHQLEHSDKAWKRWMDKLREAIAGRKQRLYLTATVQDVETGCEFEHVVLQEVEDVSLVVSALEYAATHLDRLADGFADLPGEARKADRFPREDAALVRKAIRLLSADPKALAS